MNTNKRLTFLPGNHKQRDLDTRRVEVGEAVRIDRQFPTDSGRQISAEPAVQKFLEQYQLPEVVDAFRGRDGDFYVTVQRSGGESCTWPLVAESFSDWLQEHGLDRLGGLIEPKIARQIRSVLRIVAQDKAPRATFIRIGESAGRIYFDMGASQGVAEICPDSNTNNNNWSILKLSPVTFLRPRGALPLPRPEPGGTIDDLRPFLNVADEGEFRLLVAWLLQACRPRGPYPVLVLQGQQGSAKSTTARVLQSLLDPNQATLLPAPSGVRDLAIRAAHCWLAVFDNLSSLSAEMSDALCRLSTGGAFATRTLFTDRGETKFEAMRPTVLTGIGGIVTRGDLLERAVILHLPPVTCRRTEREFWSEFEKARPKLLGAIFNAVSNTLSRLGHTPFPNAPRMADFAEWATAAGEALGWNDPTFRDAYDRNLRHAVDMALEADCLVGPIQKLLEGSDNWAGNATELLDKLRTLAPENLWRQDWPTQRTIRSRLERLAPSLRSLNIELDLRGTDGKRTIRVFRSRA